MMATKISRGSEWRKWDLHVHTPFSALDHNLGDDWNIYVEKLIDAAKTHQVAAIITADYFTIEGYRELLKFYDSNTHKLSVNGKDVELCIIPGVELRLNIFNSDDESVNLHVFFDPECSCDFITQNFLEELKIDYRGSKRMPLRQQNLLVIGKSIAENVVVNPGHDFTGVNAVTKSTYIRKALKAVTLSYGNIDDALKAIDEIFEKQKLSPKTHLVAVVGKGHGGINSLKWFEENKGFSRAGLIREHLTHKADIIFSNNQDDRQFYLGKTPETPPEEIAMRFKSLKPCVWGSDSHSIENLLHPSNGNTFDYTWIKAETTFEGLKQITYEQELRVRVQQDNPSEEETYAKIEKLSLDFPNDLKIKDKESSEALNFCIQGKHEINFSSNLTCVIGGRGSGKSSLIHLLYNLVTGRDPNRLSMVNSPLFSLQMNSKDELGKLKLLTKSDIPATTEFFLQNEVEKSAKDINEMSKLIKSRLYGLSTIDDTGKGLEEFEKEWKGTVDGINEVISAYDEITRIDQEIRVINKQKETLKKQTDVISSKEYKDIQANIKKIADEISSFDTYQKEYRQITGEISTLVKSMGRINWGKYEGQSVLTSLSAELTQKGIELKESFDKARKKHVEADHTTKLNEQKSQLKKFLKEKGLSPENIGEVAKATQQVADLDEQIKALGKERLPFQETYDRKAEIFNLYREAYTVFQKEFETVATRLQDNLANLKFDDEKANISFQLRINDQWLKDATVNFVKNSNPSRMSLRTDNIQSVLFGNDRIGLADLVSDKAKIVEIVSSSEVADAHTKIMQELVNDPTFVEKMHLQMQKYFFDIDNIQVQTRLGGKFLQSTSFGERCGIVIAIVLVAGTNPIIIDQPEDNLDGKYISRVLVPLILDQKKRRQIILVTRDANIVIGGDSELILILDKEDTGTKLLPATIENMAIRPKYVWILDGGEMAFRKREKKYSIHI